MKKYLLFFLMLFSTSIYAETIEFSISPSVSGSNINSLVTQFSGSETFIYNGYLFIPITIPEEDLGGDTTIDDLLTIYQEKNITLPVTILESQPFKYLYFYLITGILVMFMTTFMILLIAKKRKEEKEKPKLNIF